MILSYKSILIVGALVYYRKLFLMKSARNFMGIASDLTPQERGQVESYLIKRLHVE